MQRFATAAEYEGARANYCEDMVEREAMVEDATLETCSASRTRHCMCRQQRMALTTTLCRQSGVNDVRDLFLSPSPNRSMGIASAQPVLVRAGPGTGKTWMTKQAVFTLADNLRVATGQRTA